MPINPGSYQSNIHDEEYRRKYQAPARWTDAIFDAGRDKESLDGPWNFTIDPYDTCLRAEWFREQTTGKKGLPLPLDYDFERWGTAAVPSVWNLAEPELFWYEGPAVYTRTFDYQNRGEKHVFLKVGAANYEAVVFLNGQLVGSHVGGSTPFYLDVTQFLRETNRVLIVVDSTRRRGHVPTANTDWFNYGGLYRSVELIRVPETFIRDLTVSLVHGKRDRIHIHAEVSGTKNGTLRVTITELGINAELPVRNGTVEADLDARPELWTPERPRLYEIEARCGADSVSDRVGFREILCRGRDILLNGVSVFLKGISIHEESETHGKAVTDDEVRQNFAILKDLGCNFARLAHYPHAENAARIADEEGILLWEEIPVYWSIDFSSRDTYADAENQLRELIRRDKNRASVVIWSVGNENPDSDERLAFMGGLARTAKRADPTRLVSAACLVDREALAIQDRLADELDVIGINEYYGWYEPDIGDLETLFDNSKPQKPVVISEFGADALAGHRGAPDQLWTEDKQLAVYQTQTTTIARIPYIRGMTPWILFDFRCPRRTNPFQQFHNRKGLLSLDKKQKKLAYDCLKAFYRSPASAR